MRTVILSFALTVWGIAAPAVAHHSFGVAFDAEKTVTLTGTITKIEWTNPHTHIYADVKDDAGRVVSWKFEGYPPTGTVADRVETGRDGQGGRHHHDVRIPRARRIRVRTPQRGHARGR